MYNLNLPTMPASWYRDIIISISDIEGIVPEQLSILLIGVPPSVRNRLANPTRKSEKAVILAQWLMSMEYMTLGGKPLTEILVENALFFAAGGYVHRNLVTLLEQYRERARDRDLNEHCSDGGQEQ